MVEFSIACSKSTTKNIKCEAVHCLEWIARALRPLQTMEKFLDDLVFNAILPVLARTQMLRTILEMCKPIL
jgi:hypothetical protein